MRLEVVDMDVKDGRGVIHVAVSQDDVRRIQEFFAWAMKTDEKLDAVQDALDYLHGLTPEQAAELRRDRERLDYLEKYEVIAKPGQPTRAAIDEAMKTPNIEVTGGR